MWQSSHVLRQPSYCLGRGRWGNTSLCPVIILLFYSFTVLMVLLTPAACQDANATRSTSDSSLNNQTMHVGPQKVPLKATKGMSDSTKYIIIGSVCGFVAAIASVFLVLGCFKFHTIFGPHRIADHSEKEMERKFSHVSLHGDRKLAQSAQMFHFQHQKQQLIALENAKQNGVSKSLTLSEDELDQDDHVYECPGLATLQGAGSLEVKNPMFTSSVNNSVPSTPPPIHSHNNNNSTSVVKEQQ